MTDLLDFRWLPWVPYQVFSLLLQIIVKIYKYIILPLDGLFVVFIYIFIMQLLLKNIRKKKDCSKVEKYHPVTNKRQIALQVCMDIFTNNQRYTDGV